jgi:AraC-like DNA-binding protein
MIVNTFNIKDGIYAFAEEEILTATHQHPALEVVLARKSKLIVQQGNTSKSVHGCLIRANTPHAIIAKNTICDIWMFENEVNVLPCLLKVLKLPLDNHPVLEITEEQLAFFTPELFLVLSTESCLPIQEDERIAACKNYIKQANIDTPLQRKNLSALIHLSEDRLSHLFKKEVGVSIKNYIVWTRLKRTIQIMLNDNETLLVAAYQAGFHDAAHFSKAFQKMFGLNPSVVYNSSILQI